MGYLHQTDQEIWDNHGSYQWTYFGEEIKQIISFFLSKRLSGKNLDLGGGWYLSYPNSTVVDLSPVCLEHNPAENKVQFNLDDIAEGKKLPFEDHSFHSATMISSWQYLKDPRSVMKEIERVIMPGGEVYIINGQGAGLDRLIRQSTYSTEIQKFLEKIGYDTFIEDIPHSKTPSRNEEFKSVGVALPQDTLFGKESSVRDKLRWISEQEEENEPFIDAFVSDQISKAWFKFSQLRTYPITKHSKEVLESYQGFSDKYVKLTGEQPLLYLDDCRIKLDLSLPGDPTHVTMLVSPEDEKKGRQNAVSEYGNICIYISRRKDLIETLRNEKDKSGPNYSCLTKEDRSDLIEFLTITPLNGYTKAMQDMAYAAVKDFEREIIEQKAWRLYSLFKEYKQRSTVDLLISKKLTASKGRIPIVGEGKLDFERSLEHFSKFILY